MLRTCGAYREWQRRVKDGTPPEHAPAWMPEYEAQWEVRTGGAALPPGLRREVATLATTCGDAPVSEDAPVVDAGVPGRVRYEYRTGTSDALFRALTAAWRRAPVNVAPTFELDFVVHEAVLPAHDELVRMLLVWSTFPCRIDPIRVHVDRIPWAWSAVRPLVPSKVRARLQLVPCERARQ